jgi:bifunctional DNase/RNase
MVAIYSLSDKNREATLLFYFQQLSLREVATLLGISVAAVKGRLHKSRRQLRDYLIATPTGRELAQRGTFPVLHERKTQMIRVTIVDVIPPDDTEEGFKKHSCCVILADEARSRLLNIWMGFFEGYSITAGILKKPTVPRPMTYEFIANLLHAANARPVAVHISAIEETTFYATVFLQTEAGEHEIDARPSDALALAVRYNCPIHIAPEVMEKAGQPLPDDFDHDSLGKGFARYETLIEENKRLHAEHMEEIKKRAEAEEDKPEA